MPKFRTKPVEIQAIQWRGDNREDIEAFGASLRVVGGTWKSHTLQVYDFLQDTWVGVNQGDFIIRGTKGEFYPCEAEVFNWKYELLSA